MKQVRLFALFSLLATLMLPNAALLIPQYILFDRLGWVNTFLPLIVPAWFGMKSFLSPATVLFLGFPQRYDFLRPALIWQSR